MLSFSQFIRERQYLHNVSPATLEWYKHSLKWLPTESPSQIELQDAVLRMREKLLKATGCNSAIRAINAYLKWSESPLKIPQMKGPQIVLPTFTAAQISLRVSWKSRSFCQRRLHLLVLILLDTGCRITEALPLRMSEIDFDHMLVTLDGKGRKQRVVPFSFELRKALFRFITEYKRRPDALLLVSRNEIRLGRRVVGFAMCVKRHRDVITNRRGEWHHSHIEDRYEILRGSRRGWDQFGYYPVGRWYKSPCRSGGSSPPCSLGRLPFRSWPLFPYSLRRLI